MIRFVWDEKKNLTLKEERNVSFEMVLQAIEDGRLLDILEHPNREKYGGQRLYVVQIDRYVWIVPFGDKGEERVLKTLFPSRRYMRMYLGREDQVGENQDTEE